MLSFCGSELIIRILVHQVVEFVKALLINLHLRDPATAVRVVFGNLVDGAGLILQQDVGLGDLAGDWGIDIGSTLD